VTGAELVQLALRGAAAGAAGTTALNAVTYLDMALRGRPASGTPAQTVQELADRAHVDIPGEGSTRNNRIEGIASLTGLATGLGIGLLLGLVRASGWRPGPVAGTAVAAGVALVGANGPMSVLGVTDPRTWSAKDWISDIVPHLAYGVVVKNTIDAFDRP
jgi:hypothetical protein